MQIQEDFPTRLRAAHVAKGMTIADLLEATGYHKGYMSKLLNGYHKPGFDTLNRLADALEVSGDYLLGRSDEIRGG